MRKELTAVGFCERDIKTMKAFGIEAQMEKLHVQVAPARWLDGRCTRCGWEEPDEVEYDYETEPWEETPFCPMCGARMGRGGDNA